MGQPAARITDHVLHRMGVGDILEGCPTVRINGLRAARLGDKVQHGQGMELIMTGEPTVRIGGAGLLAARVGDKVMCLGCLATGSDNVRIGKTAVGNCLHQASDHGTSYVIPHAQSPAAQNGGVNE